MIACIMPRYPSIALLPDDDLLLVSVVAVLHPGVAALLALHLTGLPQMQVWSN